MAQLHVGIIGGGPGGLFTAYLLQKYANVPYRATLLEAAPCVGGKIWTKRFDRVPIHYEAGAAELYDYSVVGPDPLRELLAELGLETAPMAGHRVLMHHPLPDSRDWERFDQEAQSFISPREFYSSDWKETAGDPLGHMTFAKLLERVPEAAVQQYIRTLIHSDLATEPEATNAIYGLQNYLMNDPAYMRLYTIEGGIERLPQTLALRLAATIRTNEQATQIVPEGSRVRVTTTQGEHEFDYLVLALPNHVLPKLQYAGPLATAMQQHHAYYNYPAHYLRVTMLFAEPFWRNHVQESYFMIEAFDGCCVYVESARNGVHGYGVLGWLLGGAAAERMSALPDAELVSAMLAALPPELQPELQHGPALLLEAKVHRWVKEVNGQPSGYPPQRLEIRHLPAPTTQPNVLVVGDYLFDSTLNGVLDSATFVADWLAAEMEQRMATPKGLAHR